MSSTLSVTPAAGAPLPAPFTTWWYRTTRIDSWRTLFVAVHLALFAIPFVEFSWLSVLLFIVGTRIVGLGVTLGFHRYFSHRAFKTSRWFQFLIAVVGTASLQKGPFWWVIQHRLHHKHSDTANDPHSPVVKGWWHGHLGWLFARDLLPIDLGLVRDLTKYPELVWVDRLWWLPPAFLAAICYVIAGWSGVVYGYCLNVILVFHVTFAVNSFGHLFGARRFETSDGSRNSFVLGYLGMGDGWHNNHHRAPYSARHGFAWYELDTTYQLIRLLAWLGIVWDVKVPPASVLAGEAAPANAAGECEPVAEEVGVV
jgi:stearoyl-CoA desaturase (delta-9 desaturase)